MKKNIERLSSGDIKQIEHGLKSLETLSKNQTLPHQIGKVLESINVPTLSQRVDRLLLLTNGYRWFKSFYQVLPSFYSHVDKVIVMCQQAIYLSKGENVRDRNIKLKIKKFLRTLGEREKHPMVSYSGFVDLSATAYLRKSNGLGEHYATILEVLKQNEVVEIRPSYSPAHGYPKGYRIHRKWINPPKKSRGIKINSSKSIEIQTSQILKSVDIDLLRALQDIEFYANHQLRNKLVDVADRSVLVDNGRIGSIHLLENKNGRLELVERNNYPIVHLDKKYQRQFYFDDDKLIGSSKKSYLKWKRDQVKSSYGRVAVLLNNKGGSLVYEGDGRRLYTALTSTPKLLLPHLSIGGQHLREYDLANSQWRFLIYCLENPQLDNLISIYSRTNGQSIIQNRDYQLVRQAIFDGKFYELIQTTLPNHILQRVFNSGITYNPTRLRNAVKKLTFILLFSSNSYQPDIKKEFRKHFPTLYQICHDLKSKPVYDKLFPSWKNENLSYFKSNEKYQGKKPLSKDIYKQLPIELQRVESNVMIHDVLDELYRQLIKALTKHDSFLLPNDQFCLAKSIIKQQLDNVFGVDSYFMKE